MNSDPHLQTELLTMPPSFTLVMGCYLYLKTIGQSNIDSEWIAYCQGEIEPGKRLCGLATTFGFEART